MKINRVILIIMDSVGVGFMPDAGDYNDLKTNTLRNIYKETGKLKLPNLCSLGLSNIVDVGCPPQPASGCWGKMFMVSPGKDTTTGHWEIAGLKIDFTFPVYPDGFPRELISEFEKRINKKTLGNYPASGTVILDSLGEEHLKTGFPIVYTSADSVFQIATHEKIVPLEKLYEYCRIARSILKGKNAVSRVIARPFTGQSGAFERDNPARKDFSLEPPGETLLDKLKKEGKFVCGVGKIGDIFAHRGLTEEIKTKNNMDGVDKTIASIKKYSKGKGIIFTNLVDFDSIYGHRRDARGYARALEEFDKRVPEIIDTIRDDEVLIITADHGCDPTHSLHTDHTREYVPLLIYGPSIKKDIDLGTRAFSDCGQTIADFFLNRDRHYLIK